MVLKYNISPAPALVNEDLVVKIWESASDGPGNEVYTEVLPEKDGAGVPTPGAGHQVINTVTVNGLDKVVHIARLYTSVSATLLHEYNLEPKTDVVTAFDPIRFKIGDGDILTPAVGDVTYTNPVLIGLTENDFTVNRNNYGVLFPGTHYAFDSAFGQVSLLIPGDVMGADEEFTIERKNSVLQTVVNDSVVGKWFGPTFANPDIFVDIVANTNYDSTCLRKLIRFTGPYEFTFPTDPPIGFVFCFQHFGAIGTAKVKFDNATLLWGGVPVSEKTIQRYSEAGFVFDGFSWNVVYLIDSTFANAPGLAPGTIIATGEAVIGDMLTGDNNYILIHNKAIAGDYRCFFSIKGTAATLDSDNNVQIAWYHHLTDKPNKVQMKLGKPVGSPVMNFTLVYLLIKS